MTTALDELARTIWALDCESATEFAEALNEILKDDFGADDIRTALMMWAGTELDNAKR